MGRTVDTRRLLIPCFSFYVCLFFLIPMVLLLHICSLQDGFQKVPSLHKMKGFSLLPSSQIQHKNQSINVQDSSQYHSLSAMNLWIIDFPSIRSFNKTNNFIVHLFKICYLYIRNNVIVLYLQFYYSLSFMFAEISLPLSSTLNFSDYDPIELIISKIFPLVIV